MYYHCYHYLQVYYNEAMGLSPESKARGEKLVSGRTLLAHQIKEKISKFNFQGGKFVPRAILVDLEPGTMDSVRCPASILVLLGFFFWAHPLFIFGFGVLMVVNKLLDLNPNLQSQS